MAEAEPEIEIPTNMAVRIGTEAFMDGYQLVAGSRIKPDENSELVVRELLAAAYKTDRESSPEAKMGRVIALCWLGGRSHATAVQQGITAEAPAPAWCVRLMCTDLADYINGEGRYRDEV